MYKRDYRLYVDDIIEAIQKIEKYSKGLSFRKFSKDTKAIDATVRNFEVIGEAAKHIPPKIRKKYPSIPWKAMAGMRNKLIHEYFGLNKKVLWKTIKGDLAKVKVQTKRVLKELDEESK